MSIGTTIKKLRRERDMTQEQLAGHLGVSVGAVSQWECDRTAPDISQLPQLASIFEVSADVLLGIDVTTQEKKIEEIIFKAESCTPKEAVALYRLSLVDYPASYELMLHMADNLDYGNEPETLNARKAEQIALYEKIREGTRDAYCKNAAEGKLCGIYLSRGEREKALKIAESVPRLPYSKRRLDAMLAQGMDKIHETHHNIHSDFADLCDDIYAYTFQKLDGKPFFTHEEAIVMLEKIPKMHEIFYENGDYCGANHLLALTYTRIAEHYAHIKDGENALMCLKSAAESRKGRIPTARIYTVLTAFPIQTTRPHFPRKKGIRPPSPSRSSITRRPPCGSVRIRPMNRRSNGSKKMYRANASTLFGSV